MITLRCTRRAAKYLNVLAHEAEAPASTGRLGDWYVNAIATAAGDVYLFVNETTYLSVVVPMTSESPLQLFVRRVANILSMIGIPDELIHQELEHYAHIDLAKAVNHSVLSTMTWIAGRYDWEAEKPLKHGPMSLSDAELEISMAPTGRDDIFPRYEARQRFGLPAKATTTPR